MDALLMCGGRGTRLDAVVEKPLVEVGGQAMVDRVADALAASRVGTTHAVVSPNAPDTKARLDLPLVETPGAGYVADLRTATESVEPPVLVVAADLPLLEASDVDDVLDLHGTAGGSVAVCVPASLKRRLGASVETTSVHDGREVAPVGLNVVADGPEVVHLVDDERLAVNVNRPGDVALAEARR